MFSIFFYIFYFLLCLSSLYFVNKYRVFLLFPLLFTAQFNVTSFLKVGVTISFFEVNLILTTLGILIIQSIRKVNLLKKIYLQKQDLIWALFLGLSLLSIIVAITRVNLGNLKPDIEFVPTYYVRSIMSLNKLFFYFPCFYIIRSYLMEFYSAEEIKVYFLKAMALSGFLPALAVVIQFLGIGFTLLHNNPSFAETFRLQDYSGARPVGLTNEASFFVYQLFFANMALYYGWKKKVFNSSTFYLLALLYVFAVIFSISRTGLLIFALFYILVWFREIKIFTFSGFIRILKFLPLILIVLVVFASLNIGGFNLGQRVLSSFQSEADMSTLERYGSSKAFLQLFLDKSLFLGVGIYNHQYYIKTYLPEDMNMFYYPRGVAPASFNFIFQLFVEFGLVPMLMFFYILYKNIFNWKNDRFFKDWILFLLIFSLSFQTLNFAIPFLIFFYPSKSAV